MKFRVAAGRSLALPPIVKGRIHGRRGSLPYGMSGGFLREGEALPESFVEWLKQTKDTNGETKLQNMIDSGYVVLVEER